MRYFLLALLLTAQLSNSWALEEPGADHLRIAAAQQYLAAIDFRGRLKNVRVPATFKSMGPDGKETTTTSLSKPIEHIRYEVIESAAIAALSKYCTVSEIQSLTKIDRALWSEAVRGKFQAAMAELEPIFQAEVTRALKISLEIPTQPKQ